MVLLFSPIGFFAFFVFLAAVAVFVLAIRFFLDSRRRLSKLCLDRLPSRKISLPDVGCSNSIPVQKASLKTASLTMPVFNLFRRNESAFAKEEIKTLRFQMKQLNEALQQIQLKQEGEPYSEMKESLFEKEEKLQLLIQENRELHQLLIDLKDKHSQSVQQGQQLLKRIKSLEDINADLHQAAEAGRKLKAKMSRVVELESMIELMRERK